MSAALGVLTVEIAAIVCALLLAVRVLIAAPALRSARLIALIAVDTICAVLLGHQDYGFWTPAAFRIDVGMWAGTMNLARNLTPGLLMLLCHSLFTEQRRMPPALLALLAIQMALEAGADALVPAGTPWGRWVTEGAPALLQSLFVAVALWWTLADWRVDLVESRRRTRAVMLGVIGLSTVASVLLTRLVIDPGSVASYRVHVGLTGIDLALLTAMLLRLMGGDVRELLAVGRDAPPARSRPRAVAGEDPALARLRALLEDAVCQEPGLTLADLAARVGTPIYRLRRLIHTELGYQNFNALLHDYRVREACRQLRDPQLRRMPILTIALSVGYSSANTFNRGFRAIMRMTPSAYRASTAE